MSGDDTRDRDLDPEQADDQGRARRYPHWRVQIGIDEQDIALARGVDAIVNVAHRPDLRGGHVSESIFRRAGPLLARDPGLARDCRVGEVRMTPGYKLAVPWILHTLRPRWWHGERGEADLLRRCYRNIFTFARNRGLRSLALPVIGSGSTGFPFRLTGTIGMQEAARALAPDPDDPLGRLECLEWVDFAIPDERGYDLTFCYAEVFGGYP